MPHQFREIGALLALAIALTIAPTVHAIVYADVPGNPPTWS